MTGQLKVVGAGLGRTGTHTLKVVLERLLGGPCHHMVEVFQHPEQWDRWQQAVDGEPLSVWGDVFDGYVATVDWPSCRWYAELAEANPDAIVLLSVRESADAWYRSASNTIFKTMPTEPGEGFGGWAVKLIGDHIGSPHDPEAAKAGYERHNAEVRATIPASRLLEWQATDGWEPLCAALGVPVPDEPFPVTNTTEEFNANIAAGRPPGSE
jgi:hypothetical protein